MSTYFITDQSHQEAYNSYHLEEDYRQIDCLDVTGIC